MRRDADPTVHDLDDVESYACLDLLVSVSTMFEGRASTSVEGGEVRGESEGHVVAGDVA